MKYHLYGIVSFDVGSKFIETESLVAIFDTFELADTFSESCIDYKNKRYYSFSPLGKFDSFEIRAIETNPSPMPKY